MRLQEHPSQRIEVLKESGTMQQLVSQIDDPSFQLLCPLPYIWLTNYPFQMQCLVETKTAPLNN
jgi:hypothetical protein